VAAPSRPTHHDRVLTASSGAAPAAMLRVG
jgi:hypothetical protein